jgi:hypothetical protein
VEDGDQEKEMEEESDEKWRRKKEQSGGIKYAKAKSATQKREYNKVSARRGESTG